MLRSSTGQIRPQTFLHLRGKHSLPYRKNTSTSVIIASIVCEPIKHSWFRLFFQRRENPFRELNQCKTSTAGWVKLVFPLLKRGVQWLLLFPHAVCQTNFQKYGVIQTSKYLDRMLKKDKKGPFFRLRITERTHAPVLATNSLVPLGAHRASRRNVWPRMTCHQDYQRLSTQITLIFKKQSAIRRQGSRKEICYPSFLCLLLYIWVKPQ